MTTFRDIPAGRLLPALSLRLAEMESISAPEWADLVKTGTHRERPPEQDDWWTTRCAAVLRKVAIHGPIGTNHLAQRFGGPKDRGVKPNRAVAGSRSIARNALQQLEASGLVESRIIRRDPQPALNVGRVITPAAQSLLDEIAHDIRSEVEAEVPALSKY